MIAVLTSLVVVLLGSHFFLYFSLIKFFSITLASTKMWLAIALSILAVSFILASLLSHYVENLATKIFYFSAGVWLGIGLNLAVAFIVSWIIVGIMKFFGVQFDHKYLAMLSIIFALIFSGWGVWNVYHPKIKNITVKIKNLPEQWRGKTAVQISDVHLGLILGNGFLENVVQKINAENPSVVFITGDFFDGMDGILADLVKPLNEIKAPQGTYFVTGNHETYLGVKEVFSTLEKTPVKILRDEKVDVDGMQILGVSFPERGESKDIEKTIENMPGFDSKNPSILLLHSPSMAPQAKAAGVSLQLAGHTHNGQLFPIEFISRLIYGKYFYGLHTDGDFAINTSAGTGTWGPTMRTNSSSEIVIIHFE